MKYLEKSFSVSLTGNKRYEENYNSIFRKTLKQKVKEFIDNLIEELFLK